MMIKRDAALGNIESVVLKCLTASTSEREVKPLLVVDGFDLLLAATSTSATEVLNTMMEWREVRYSDFDDALLTSSKHAYATIFSAAADYPLIHCSNTPLESEHATLVAGLATQAYFVTSLRLLSTGVAKDVSGVLRISRGGACGDVESEAKRERIEEKEVLYLVGGDGGVKVFERGAGE